jgi:hypothetical protein
MTVRIHQPAKNAMQSGRATTRRWLVEFEPAAPRQVEPLMGWTSSADTRQQLRLWFATKEEAIAYCEREGLMYQVEEARPRTLRPKAYADNFAAGRPFPWTH